MPYSKTIEEDNSVRKGVTNLQSNTYKTIFEKIVITLSFAISVAVLFGWLFSIKEILTLTDNAASMKFNTALVFLLSSINLILVQKKERSFRILKNILAYFIILIGILSLISDFGFSFLNIDNLIVYDDFSIEKPGLMSRATAFCTICLGIVFVTFTDKREDYNPFQKIANTSIFTIALISIISYILIIPLENRTSIFKTMSIHTSLLYLLIPTVLMIKNPYSFYNELIVGDRLGNKIFRKLAPKLIIVPIVMANILLILIEMEHITLNFGVICYTIILIVLSFIYTSIVAVQLNKTDKSRKSLKKKLIADNIKLNKFKEGIDQIANIVLTKPDGTIKHVNEAMCNNCLYSKEELLGNNYSILSSGFHDKTFFKEFWQTINNGQVWTGDIKNKRKDGTFYWIHSTVIPLTDKNDNIVEYMSFDMIIDKPV